MTRILFFLLFALFLPQDNDLSAKTKGPSGREVKAAEKIIGRYGSGNTRVTIKTSQGTIVVMLYDETPQHRDNFVRHAEQNTYNGILFHRVIRDFMIQAGDPASKNSMATAVYGATSVGEEIPAEIRGELFHHRGALAAARSGDEVNPERNSSGSQFYIVTGEVQTDSALNVRPDLPADRVGVYRTVGGVPHLDQAYTVFGRVVKGQKVVDKISTVQTDYKDRPRRDIFIRRMTVRNLKK